MESFPLKSALNHTVSAVRSYTDIKTVDVNLLAFLTSTKYKTQIDHLRSVCDKTARTNIKQTLPAVMVSGRFKSRGEQYLIEHSGLIAFDIDDVKDIVSTKKAIATSPYVAYLALSASGRGLFGIMAVSNPEKHKEHFKAMAKYIELLCGLKIDPAPSSICSLRGYSYDEDPYINHFPEPFNDLIATPVQHSSRVAIRPDIALNHGLFETYNAAGDVRDLLAKHGWQLQYVKGPNHYYSRPGKDTGVSADYCIERRVLYVFTSSTILEAGKGYDNVGVFCALECGGDYALARRKLLAKCYGRKINLVN